MFEKPLSPATQAVSDAIKEEYLLWEALHPGDAERIAAAALRAAVDSVVPESKCYSDTNDGTMRSTDLLMVRRLFYAIIKELEETK